MDCDRGREAAGVADSVYVSVNNGNTWSKAPQSLAMPTYINPRAFASVMVVDADFTPQARLRCGSLCLFEDPGYVGYSYERLPDSLYLYIRRGK